LKTNRDKLFFLYYLDLEKRVAYYSKCIVLKEHVEFDLNASETMTLKDKERPEEPKKFKDFELQELLDENPTQTFLELSILYCDIVYQN